MPINQSTKHKQENTLYLACSGGGKSQALYQNAAIPRRGVRAVMFDPDSDHPAKRFDSLSGFKAALIAALKQGGGFRIAYSGEADVKIFEAWCKMIWAILDGNHKTYIIIEELATVTETVTKATRFFGLLLNRGRKYGAKIHMTTQRGTEICKTAYIQSKYKYVGVQEGNDIKKMADLCAISQERIRQLSELEYWFKQAGPHEPLLIKLDYIEPIHQRQPVKKQKTAKK